jgi:hypothetical protein
LLWSFESTAVGETTSFLGSISNSFYRADGTVSQHEGDFEMSVNGLNSTFNITNRYQNQENHALFTNGEFSVVYRKPETHSDTMSPEAARTEKLAVPREDGSWINYLWVALGSHVYFNSRTNQDADPVWTTGLNANNQKQMGIRAVYQALQKAPFPNRVDYISQGFMFFESRSTKMLQKAPLDHPLDLGYTNFSVRVTGITNIEDRVFPIDIVIKRYRPKQENGRLNELTLLVESQIHIQRIERGDKPLLAPNIGNQTVVIDERYATPTSRTPAVFMIATNGQWPSSSQSKHAMQVVEKLAVKNEIRRVKNIWPRRLALICLATLAVAPPLTILMFRLRKKHKAP